ncbi:MAG: ATP-binding protein [Oscillospiraceae bacterium]|nr:ATP-binding protein [Oscillospiraceae bacterium]
MNEITYDRIKESLEALKLRHTLEALDNYMERAMKDELNIVEVLDHIFTQEALDKRRRACEQQVQMSGFPMKKALADFDFSFQPSIDRKQNAQ